MIWALAALGAPAWAAEEGAVALSVHGDVKTFFVATIPYENELFESIGAMPADPTAQGILDGRLKLGLAAGGARLLAHHAVTATTASAAASPTQTGVGVSAPQFVDLDWRALPPDDGDAPASADAMTLQGRTDRLSVAADLGPVRLTAGRQPITLGHGLAFTPMDLVNPFFPTTVDQEYKPGVDAFTADWFFGMSSQVSVIAAYLASDPVADAEDWGVAGMAYALYAQHTFGRHDVGLLLAEIRGDEVAGLTVASYAGPVSLHGDFTYTLPADPDAEDPFFRGVAGAMWMPGSRNTSLSAEVYYQSLGAADPDGYLTQLSGDRYLRGELWLAGTTYASASVGQEITPLVQASLAVIANVMDPSAMVAPNVSVSVSDEVALILGGFGGLGRRPEEVALEDLFDPEAGGPLEGEALNAALGVQSEFGFYPSSAYAQLKAYF